MIFSLFFACHPIPGYGSTFHNREDFALGVQQKLFFSFHPFCGQNVSQEHKNKKKNWFQSVCFLHSPPVLAGWIIGSSASMWLSLISFACQALSKSISPEKLMVQTPYMAFTHLRSRSHGLSAAVLRYAQETFQEQCINISGEVALSVSVLGEQWCLPPCLCWRAFLTKGKNTKSSLHVPLPSSVMGRGAGGEG